MRAARAVRFYRRYRIEHVDSMIANRHRTLRGLAMSTCMLIIALSACGWSPALNSDPEAWSPAATALEDTIPAIPDGRDAGADGALCEACNVAPPFDLGLTQSSASSLSHRAGQPCLEACHEECGTARSIFAVAGTAYRAAGDRAPIATDGLVHSVAGTTLSLDRCGNFYAVAAALATTPQNTQPFVQNPIFRRMERPLVRERNAGSCNRVSCHDFRSSSKSGIYF